MNGFVRCHPAAAFLYFMAVIGSSMFLLHPICTPVSLLFALCAVAAVCGRRSFLRSLWLSLLLVPASAVINALFSHAGITVLGFLPSGNPLTLESLLYGAAAGGMLAAVLAWFSCFHAVMTSDKLLWLFARLAPSLSLLLSMILRFVPRFRTQFASAATARRAVSHGAEGGGLARRVQSSAAILAAMTTRALEGSVDTADAMRARGYGLGHRTSYSVFRMRPEDLALLITTGLFAFGVAAFSARGALHVSFYPVFSFEWCAAAWIAYGAYGMLCALPLFFGLSEVKKWRF